MLWFKNIVIYRLTKRIELSVAEIEKKLSDFIFTSCSGQDIAKSGWISPMGDAYSPLIHATSGHLFLCLRTEEKVIPPSVIKKSLEDKNRKLKSNKNRKLYKNEEKILREEIFYELIPRAFSRFTETFLWINLVDNMVIINVSNFKKAENCLSILRKSIGSLPIVPLRVKNPIEIILTQWVRTGEPAPNFIIQDEVELKMLATEGGTCRCKKQDLSSSEIIVHIKAGKMVTRLALEWKNRIQFLIDKNCLIKRLKLSDQEKEYDNIIQYEDSHSHFYSDFTLITSELTPFIADLIKSFGGVIL
ncbi:DNA recombination-dependent growth factor C [secondary endosymbiont of Heteropsylla cubana]|uniref:Recombination-associated protein RdgC n=1 Tax=secondary endosymbiont of Heteropsylla cubana TaxID=134287 RepID=J3VTY3_9ENTR|nr:recombination-associated protein RdgC [secondary endosymbiont of Heteropsylla cubana]AFP85516.1 DNA recombination-dependent growth factor C [secondary endosymbiont of Heteropsylla cubana]